MEKAKARKLSQSKRYNLTGWVFLTPAALLIAVFSFYPMIKCFIYSFQKGSTFANMQWYGINNYIRMFQDKVFMKSLGNTFVYFLIQVPIMLILALILASVLNIKDLKGKGIFRTAIFLPCCTSLVSYAIIFKTLFSYDGYVNTVLMNLGLISESVKWLSQEGSAKVIIILALIWRWTGYNMVFYLAGLQNIDDSLYEAAKIDGANAIQSFFKITVPMLKPTILLTTIMSTNGTLQLFDESVNLTGGGPANSTLTMSHYIYKASFEYNPQFGYAAAMSYVIFILVAILAFVQMKVGDKR